MRAHEGSRLKAFVVLRDGVTEEAARASLRDWARAHLSAPETPADIVFGAELPRDEHGKLADWPARRTARI
jgi:acyl-coenzyme A synthetase/AMP-(fatty) acid ligase